MPQTEYSPPDWGHLLTVIDRALAEAGPASEVVSYSIAGRTITKNRMETVRYREWVAGMYNAAKAGGTITTVDNRQLCYGGED